MKKLISILSLLLFIAAPMVFASEEIAMPSSQVEMYRGSLEQGTSADSLFFLPVEDGGVLDTEIRNTYRYEGRNDFPDYVGEKCNVGEAIVPFRCHVEWDECVRVFENDWIKSSETDVVPMYQWKDESWLADDTWFTYKGYHCKNTDPDIVESNGRFIEIDIPSEVTGGRTMTIAGKYQVTNPGPFILEGNIETTSRKPLAVAVESSKSSCDGSLYWAGSEIEGVKGEIYNFKFTVKTPTKPGKYQAMIHSWTDCWEEGGEQIDRYSKEVIVKKPECNFLSVTSDIGKILNFWSLSSTRAQSIMDLYECSYGDMDAFCGDKDTDKDGIPDGCDFCPQDKGIPQEANGCHPCYGMDVYSEEGKDCYKEYYEEYGVPERLKPIVNPVVEKDIFCENNAVVTQNHYRFGDYETVSNNDCGSKDCVEKEDYAVCESPEESIEKVDESYACSGDNVIYIEYFNDGTKSKTLHEECNDYCYEGACKSSETCEGGRECGDGEPGITPEDGDCSTDKDCSGSSFCEDGTCRNPDDWCSTDENCESGYECLGGVCTEYHETECTSASDCLGKDPECVDGYCIDLQVNENSSYEECTENTLINCETGGSVISHICKDGESIPTGRDCVNDDGEDKKGLIDFTGNGPIIPYTVGFVASLAIGGIFLLIYVISTNPKRRIRK